MDTSLVLGIVGVVGTLSGGLLTARIQRSTTYRHELMQPRIAAYGECATALQAYRQATFARAKTRLSNDAPVTRATKIESAYAKATEARASINRVALIAGSGELHDIALSAYESVKKLNRVNDRKALTAAARATDSAIDRFISMASTDLHSMR